MRELHCQHCNSIVNRGDIQCDACGMQLSSTLGEDKPRRFKIWFVILVLFCIFMMIWLPPDWSWFMGK